MSSLENHQEDLQGTFGTEGIRYLELCDAEEENLGIAQDLLCDI